MKSSRNFEEIVAFIRGLYKTQEFIPLHEPRFIGNEKKYLNECIDSTFVSSVGKFVDQFEEKVREVTGCGRAISVVNGTQALYMALILNGVKPGDEVITQPLTFVATANAITYTGAHPIFIDVDRDTLGLSPDSLVQFLGQETMLGGNGERYNIKTGNRISACVPMHTFGHPCRIESIAAVCRQFNIALIEDAAESLGSLYQGRHTGTFGRAGILSFNGNKILTTGGGGMILTNDTELGNLAKHLTTQAKVPHKWEFFHDMTGYNFRMPNINAAIGLAQLEQLPSFLVKKRKLAETYRGFFSQMDIEFVTEPLSSVSNYWLNSILLNDRLERDAFLEYTNQHGVMTRPAWTLMNKLPMFSSMVTTNLTTAEDIEDRLVNIPSSVIL